MSKYIRQIQGFKRVMKGLICPKCQTFMPWAVFEEDKMGLYDQLVRPTKKGKFIQYCSPHCMFQHNHKYTMDYQNYLKYKKKADHFERAARMRGYGEN